MEWLGINLNGYRQHIWVIQSRKSLFKFIGIVTSATVLSIIILCYSQDLSAINRRLASDIHTARQQLAQLEQHIAQLKQQRIEQPSEKSLSVPQIRQFLTLMSQLHLDGALETVTLHHQDTATLAFTGHTSPTAFKRWENELKQQKYAYQISRLQTDEEGKLDFHLSISW